MRTAHFLAWFATVIVCLIGIVIGFHENSRYIVEVGMVAAVASFGMYSVAEVVFEMGKDENDGKGGVG